MEKYDFSGWATRNDIKCTDGRTIRRGAFKHNDGKTVPLVWMHKHDDISQVLGHAILENRDDGVYAYGVFNETEAGQAAKILVHNGDVNSLSIWANHLQQDSSKNVMHGDIKELSLVLAGANSGATIEHVVEHYDDDTDEIEFEADICMHSEITIYHSDDEDESLIEEGNIEEIDESEDDTDEEVDDDTESEETIEHADKEAPDMGAEEKTVQDVIDTMNEEQKNVLYALVGMAAEGEEPEEGDEEMRHSVFEGYDETNEDVISHDDMVAVLSDIKRYGSLQESALQHGVENLELLFPEAKTMSATPEFIKRDTTWVDKVMNGVHKVPFSRIKSIFADITEDEARAKGYIKGKYKKEEVFSLLKRTTQPTTIYKKQKFDRDDLIDITDFDMVAWVKLEMRLMLNEEIARGILLGDGRLTSDDDHIDENCLRPIWKEEDLFTIKVSLDANLADEDAVAKNFIRKVIKARKDYKGSGNPTLFTTEDMLTDMLLLTDDMGRDLYDSVEKLKNKLRVSDIVTVPVMENQTRTDNGTTKKLHGIIVNLADYNYGADKGGAVTMFDDFDIDYNKQIYLIETRGSGALVKPFSAMAIEQTVSNG